MSNISNINGYKITAESASYAATASYLQGNVVSASFSSTASYVLNAVSSSFSTTSSYALTAQTLLGSVTSASFASTASYVNPLNQNVTITGRLSVSNGIDVDFLAPYGTTGPSGIELNTYNIYDSAGSQSIQWDLRELRDPTFLSIDWQNRTLYDGAGTASIDWQYSVSGDQRSLIDDNGIISLRWNGRRLTDNSDNLSINWSNDPADGRSLYDTFGNKILLWDSNSTSFFSGSLYGTASWAQNAVTASYFSGSISNAVNATSASFATTASYVLNAVSSSFATTASYVNGMITKNNAVANTAFTGTPRKATVTFTTAFPNTNYSVVVTGEDARSWTIESKLAGSFVINTNSNAALAGNTYWQATSYGEFRS